LREGWQDRFTLKDPRFSERYLGVRLSADLVVSILIDKNANVLITVGGWLSRLFVLTALVGFAVSTTIGLHAHIVVSPDAWLHHLGAGYAGGSFQHLIVTLTVAFVGITLESLVLCREAFAQGEPSAIAAVLATARRLFHGVRRAALLVVGLPALRPASRGDRNADDGILRQLRAALSIAPMAPPVRLVLGSDPRGPFGQSGHRAEVSAAA
jgi:hypothetical protein